MEPTRTLEALRDDTEPAVSAAPTEVAAGAAVPLTLAKVHTGIWESLRFAWADRRLLRPFMAIVLAKRISGTKLGRLWLVIRPFMDAIGKTLLFGGVLKLSSGSGTPYLLFLMAGLIGWRLFERTLMYGMRSISMYTKLIKTFHFPLLFVGFSGLAYPLLEAAVSAVVFAAALIFFWVTTGHLYLEPPPQLLLIVPGLGLLLIITIGATLWLSVANAKARDFRYGLRYVLPVGLFVTPILYPVEKLPEKLHWLVVVNPLTGPIEMIKYGLIGSGYIELRALVVSCVVGLILLLSGLWYFCREAVGTTKRDLGGAYDDDEEF